MRIVESLIPSTSGTLTDAEALEMYRKLYVQSGPVLRLLQSLLMVLSRAAAEHRSGAASSGQYPILPVTFMLLYPVLRGILMLPHTMPGTEHTFHLLDRYVVVFQLTFFCFLELLCGNRGDYRFSHLFTTAIPLF